MSFRRPYGYYPQKKTTPVNSITLALAYHNSINKYSIRIIGFNETSKTFIDDKAAWYRAYKTPIVEISKGSIKEFGGRDSPSEEKDVDVLTYIKEEPRGPRGEKMRPDFAVIFDCKKSWTAYMEEGLMLNLLKYYKEFNETMAKKSFYNVKIEGENERKPTTMLIQSGFLKKEEMTPEKKKFAILTVDRKAVARLYAKQESVARQMFSILREETKAINEKVYRKGVDKHEYFIEKPPKYDEENKNYFIEFDIGLVDLVVDILTKKGYIFIGKAEDRKPIKKDKFNVELKKTAKGESFKLRDYQKEAIKKIVGKYYNGLIKMATGAGKTAFAMGLIGEIGEDTIFIVPNQPLAKQTYDAFKERGFPNVGIFYGETTKDDIAFDDKGINVNIAVMASVSKLFEEEGTTKYFQRSYEKKVQEIWEQGLPEEEEKKALEKLRSKMEKGKEKKEEKREEAKEKRELFRKFMEQSNVIFFDEAHHVQANTYKLHAKYNPASYRFGLSATPFGDNPSSSRTVEAHLGKIIVDVPASRLIKEIDKTTGYPYLAQPIIKHMKLPITDKIANQTVETFEVYRKESKYNKLADGQLWWWAVQEVILHNNELRDSIIGATCVRLKALEMPTIIIAERIDYMEKLMKTLLNFKDPFNGKIYNMKSDLLFAKSTGEERTEIVQQLKERKLDFVFGTSGLVGEGLDIPPLMCLIVADGGKSFIKAFQRVGRVMRPHLSESTDFRKTHSLVIEFQDIMGFNPNIFKGQYRISKFYSMLLEPEFRHLEGKVDYLPIRFLGEHFKKRMNTYTLEKEYIIQETGFPDVTNFFKIQGVNPWLKP